MHATAGRARPRVLGGEGAWEWEGGGMEPKEGKVIAHRGAEKDVARSWRESGAYIRGGGTGGGPPRNKEHFEP